MSQKYYQEYGPIRRRRSEQSTVDDEPPQPPRKRVPEEPRRPLRRPRQRRLLLGPALIIVCVLGSIVALPFVTTVLAGDRPTEGVTVQGQPVGGMSQAMIQTELEKRYGDFLNTPVTLQFEGQEWKPSLAELGARLDLEQTSADAVTIGRRGDLLSRAQELWSLWRDGGYDVAPRLAVDTRALQTYLASLARNIDQPPRNAALSVASGKVIPTRGETGRQLLVDSTALDILGALQTLTPQQVVIRTRILEPSIGHTQLAQAEAEAQRLLQQPLTLQQGERTWTWEPDKIAELLNVSTHNGTMTVQIDPERLRRKVDDLAQVVDSGSAEPRVIFNGGALEIAEQGKIGLRLRQEDTITAISETLRLEQRSIVLPVDELKPQVTPETLASLGIKELVGEGKTSFAGSADYRITNIKAGARRMDGVLIPPDSEFSFNTQLGEVDEANGFVQGYAVIGNRTQLEWGGGVCQDSTTLFRAAFWAGLPITERHAHPFYISWYDDYSFPGEAGPGMDATIYTGVSDLKFFNDTGHWLLLEAHVDEAAQVLTMRLYGTKPNRTVSIIGPTIDNVVSPPSEPRVVNDASLPAGTYKQTDVARKGMDIAVYRVITENGEQKEPELFFTRFKAWPNVFVRGTGQ